MPSHSSYQLKQAQYAAIYQASERTIRNWMQKDAPLDVCASKHPVVTRQLNVVRTGCFYLATLTLKY